MSHTIDYYLAPQSPWTYLGHSRFHAIAQEANLSSYKVEFVQRPLSPKEEFLRSLTQGQAGIAAPTSLFAKFTTLSMLNDLVILNFIN